MMVQLSQALSVALLAVSAIAHPGGNINRDIKRREDHLNHAERRSLQSCKSELEASGWLQHQMDRRHARVNELKRAAGYAPISKRDAGLETHEWGKRASCTLDPEQTEGPYWVSGELIRSNTLPGVTGKEETGVITHLEINVIDVTTCQPVTNAFVELWGCNSTGVYTGVVAKGNGDGSASEIKNNALRGIQPTMNNGTAAFLTVIPGHYVGRANHLHTVIHHGATQLPNNTIQGGTISHVGQFYVQQDTLASMEATAPYNTNKQNHTLNKDDFLYTMAKQGGDDPELKITKIGTDWSQGIYASIDVGVNPKAQQKPVPVNMWTANGGIPVPGSMWAGYPWTKRALEALGF